MKERSRDSPKKYRPKEKTERELYQEREATRLAQLARDRAPLSAEQRRTRDIQIEQTLARLQKASADALLRETPEKRGFSPEAVQKQRQEFHEMQEKEKRDPSISASIARKARELEQRTRSIEWNQGAGEGWVKGQIIRHGNAIGYYYPDTGKMMTGEEVEAGLRREQSSDPLMQEYNTRKRAETLAIEERNRAEAERIGPIEWAKRQEEIRAGKRRTIWG
jgi:hypothetical protein